MSVGLSCLALSLPPRDWRVRLWTDALALAVWHCRVTVSESAATASEARSRAVVTARTHMRPFFFCKLQGGISGDYLPARSRGPGGPQLGGVGSPGRSNPGNSTTASSPSRRLTSHAGFAGAHPRREVKQPHALVTQLRSPAKLEL